MLGRWHIFDDGIVRPVVEGSVQTPLGEWEPVRLLLDAGADRTVLNSAFLSLLSSLALPESETPELGGVGGNVGCILIQTRLACMRLACMRNDGNPVTVQGPFAVFTDPLSSDVSVLGRDVTNNFDVIYSYPKRRVTLLAPPHDYEIKLSS